MRAIDGAPLPEFADGAILLPAGARGPAFLVGPNFRAILRYNNSTSYALAVSLLAQRLSGGTGVQAPWPRDLPALTRSHLLALQTALNERGFDSGTPDGLMGPATRDALRRYQRSIGLPADGYPDAGLAAAPAGSRSGLRERVRRRRGGRMGSVFVVFRQRISMMVLGHLCRQPMQRSWHPAVSRLGRSDRVEHRANQGRDSAIARGDYPCARGACADDMA